MVLEIKMDWKDWIGKKVFIRTKRDKVYSGIIKSIDDSSKPLIFINIIDKFNNKVMLVYSDIVEMKEEN